jgi:hypothetical protein
MFNALSGIADANCRCFLFTWFSLHAPKAVKKSKIHQHGGGIAKRGLA